MKAISSREMCPTTRCFISVGRICRMLWEDMPNVVAAYAECCGSICRMLWEDMPNVVAAYAECCGSICRMLWQHMPNVVAAHAECCGSICRMLWQHMPKVVAAHAECCGSICRMLWQHMPNVVAASHSTLESRRTIRMECWNEAANRPAGEQSQEFGFATCCELLKLCYGNMLCIIAIMLLQHVVYYCNYSIATCCVLLLSFSAVLLLEIAFVIFLIDF